MIADLDARRRRAGYRAAHRGTKEMDWLLGRYAEQRLPAMGEAELAHFEQLLGEPDPTLQHWILDGTAVPDDRYVELIATLRVFHKLSATG